MADDFTNRAAYLAAQAVETELINATRDFEDAQRIGGEDGASLAADALKRYATHKREFDELTGANQPQRQDGQLVSRPAEFSKPPCCPWRRHYAGTDARLRTGSRTSDQCRS